VKYGKWLALAGAYVAAFAANVGYFWWSWKIGAWQTAATAVYLVACSAVFWAVRKQREHMWRGMLLGGLTAAAGCVGLLIRMGLTALTLPGLLLAGVFVTPLYGLLGWLPDFDAAYAFTAALGLLMVLISWGLRKRCSRGSLA